MRYERIINIQQLLDNSTLSNVMKKGLFLNGLNARLTTLFPIQYRGLYWVVDMTEDSLILQVKNASVRQALLFQQRTLLELVQKDFPKIKKLTFQINPELESMP